MEVSNMVITSLALFLSSLSFVAVVPSEVYIDSTSHDNSRIEYSIDIDEFVSITSSYNNVLLTYNDGNITYNFQPFKFCLNHISDNDYEFGFSSVGSFNYFYSFTLSYYDTNNVYRLYSSPMVYKMLKYDNWSDGRTIQDLNIHSSGSLTIYFYLFDADMYNSNFVDGSYNDGYNDGVEDGYNTGYDSGYNDGYNTGNNDGYLTGYDIGHDSGYLEGYNYALSTHDFSFNNLFYSIGDTPILMLRRLFGFELFGLNLMSVFMSLFTALVLIHIIKKVL